MPLSRWSPTAAACAPGVREGTVHVPSLNQSYLHPYILQLGLIPGLQVYGHWDCHISRHACGQRLLVHFSNPKTNKQSWPTRVGILMMVSFPHHEEPHSQCALFLSLCCLPRSYTLQGPHVSSTEFLCSALAHHSQAPLFICCLGCFCL